MSEDATPWSANDAAIYDTLRSCLDEGRTAAVATVVDVEGSAYRRPGAKMVVPADGDHLGAITAGCLEGPVAELAATVREHGVPRVETYDLTDDEGWGMGLGCNGVITILVEPVDASLAPMLEAVADHRSVAVLTRLADGARATVEADGSVTTGGDRPALPDGVVAALRDRAAQLRTDGRAATVTVETGTGEHRVFVDGVRPVPELVIVGSQADVNPVAHLARAVGFRVTVAATRGNVDADRFGEADRVEFVRAPDVDSVVEAPEHTSAVVMTHNFIDDRLALEALLDTQVSYVGLMGPRERFEEMQAEWETEDGVPPGDLDRIATPVGLDLGGGSPMEIALSIVAEVVADRHDRDGGRLTDREGPIHARLSEQLD
ncbi:MAG: XdhC family protein [Halobacteriaceae archaeon]